MIRPSNIDKNGKKADFKCDKHGGSVEKLDLKTKAKRIKNKPDWNLGIPDETPTVDSEDVIIIEGSDLTPPCNCTSVFPTWDPKNKLGHALGEAKTKND